VVTAVYAASADFWRHGQRYTVCLPQEYGTLNAESFPEERILELYRLKWQVELAFKRLKSIMQLGQLPKTDPESCRAWLYGKRLYALLCYAIVDKGRFFPHGGYLLKVS